MKRILSVLLSLSLLLMLTTGVNAEMVLITEEAPIRTAVDQYFSEYFSTFDGTYKTTKFSDYVLEDEFARDYNEYLYELNGMFDLYAKDIIYKIHDLEFEILKEVATVTAYCDYNMVYSATGVNSSVSNEEFTFSFKKENGEWVISNLESTDLLFKSLSEQYDKADSQKSVSSESFFDDQIAIMGEYKEFEKKALDNRYEYQAPVTKSSYGYSSSDGVEYASVFAEADDSDYIFYDAGLDCTNFVSQCVWAAYAGFDKNDISQAETDITNNKCMVTSYPSGWHASGPGGGGYPNWESVTNFYDYCVSSKTYGPKGTGWGGYAVGSLSPYAPSVGNVLQWSYSSSSSSYAHSTYVTYNSYNGSTNGVYVSYHTSDNWNKPLTYLINAYDYVRGISFSSANF